MYGQRDVPKAPQAEQEPQEKLVLVWVNYFALVCIILHQLALFCILNFVLFCIILHSELVP